MNNGPFPFSSTSLFKLNTCHPNLVRLFKEVSQGFNCTVLEGHRSVERQYELWITGQSKVKVSHHQSEPSMAIDVTPYPIDWDDYDRHYLFAGYVLGAASRLGIKVRWGGDWDGDKDLKDQKFNDLVHFELA